MADAIISVVTVRVTAIIEDQIRYQVNLVRGIEKEILDLSDKLKTIRNVLDDAEKRGVNEQSVKNWLKKLEDIAYEMDDVLDEWSYALLKHKLEDPAQPKVCCSFIPSSCLCFNKVSIRRDTAKKIQNVRAMLDKILKEKDEFNFLMSSPAPDPLFKSWRVQSTSSIELENIYGRDEDRNNIVRKVMVDGDSQIVAIVGMGGLGKTTLAQLVYNDTQIKECFDLRIWICVSDPFDVCGIAKGIVDSVGKETIPPNTNQLELVLQKLRDSISGKKFLLVLDDVWTEDYKKWEPLKINLKYGTLGCKILVTTRNRVVAKMMGTLDKEIYCPQQLTNEECWMVLRHNSLSGRSEEECGKFEDVGKKIASKCKGLPLAANVLGSLLQFKNSLEEWENVLHSEIWQLDKAEVELFPHLLLSYNELPQALKRCFSYCAIYPKDSRIHVWSLIEEWMGLGYLGYDLGNGGVELKGREYFNILAMRSFFQEFEKSDSGEQVQWCKMHDIVHNFALFVRKNDDRVQYAEMTKRNCQVCDPLLVSQIREYRSLFWNNSTPPSLCECLTSLRVLKFKQKLNGPPHGMDKLIHLRWLKLSRTILSKEDLKLICRLHFLQTLLLASCSLEEIPREIGNLVHLRHLNLRENEELKELPESLCSLLELQILKIEHCWNLNRLPEGIHRLQNLQIFLTSDTPVSRHFPQGVSQLSCLRRLSEFHGGNGCNKFGLLKNLNRLAATLELHVHFSSSSDLKELAGDAREAELRNKMHIQALNIRFHDEKEGPSPLWMDEVIEALEPNRYLKILEIWAFNGSKLPNWISSPLNLIKEIKLIGFSELSSLPPMGKLPLLEVLYMEQLKELKVVAREFLGIESSSSSTNDFVVAFPKLKELTFFFCSELSEWEDITVEEEESPAISVMPCLTRLRIYSCVGLEKLPHRILHKASSLQILNIFYSPELQKTYEDEDGSPWRSISRNNPQLRLYY